MFDEQTMQDLSELPWQGWLVISVVVGIPFVALVVIMVAEIRADLDNWRRRR